MKNSTSSALQISQKQLQLESSDNQCVPHHPSTPAVSCLLFLQLFTQGVLLQKRNLTD